MLKRVFAAGAHALMQSCCLAVMTADSLPEEAAAAAAEASPPEAEAAAAAACELQYLW